MSYLGPAEQLRFRMLHITTIDGDASIRLMAALIFGKQMVAVWVLLILLLLVLAMSTTSKAVRHSPSPIVP